MQDISELVGKEVEVLANGMSYRGTLVEVSDTEVHLKTPMQWVALPASSVSQIKAVVATRAAEADKLDVEIRRDNG